MARPMGLRAYARHRGVTLAAVQKAIRSSRIKRRRDGKIDADLADVMWEANTDQSKPLNSVTGNPKHRRETPDAPSTPGVQISGAADATDSDGQSNGAIKGRGYARYHEVREAYAAANEKQKYLKSIGSLASIKDMMHMLFEACHLQRDQVIPLMKRLSSMYDGLEQPAREKAFVAEGYKLLKILQDLAGKIAARVPVQDESVDPS